MALTNDEINEILELYGRGYSGRKIAGQTGHSEVTIYKVVRLAKERVTDLITEGMDTDQILSQLGYPVPFVNRVIGETDSTRITGEKGKSKTEGLAEELELPHEVDIQADWDQFQEDQELEQGKDRLRERVNEFIEALELSKERFRQRSVFDVEFQERQSALESKLEDFLLKRIDEIENMGVLSELETISEDVFRNINGLTNEYNIKADQVEKARKAQEKAHEDARIAQEKAREQALSNGLLSSVIDRPMFPDFVKGGIRSKFLVRSPYEARIIRDALFQINLEIMQEYGFIPGHNEEVWQAYMDKINSGGGDYIEKLASKYERDMVNSLVSINVCPSCESRLSRKYIEGRTFVDCSLCARSYEILKE